MERRSANRLTWIESGFGQERSEALTESLDSLLHSSRGGRWAWLVEEDSGKIRLLICTGKVKPHRTRWSAALPSQDGPLSPEQVRSLSPFHKSTKDLTSLRFVRTISGGLVLDGAKAPSSRLVAELDSQLELIAARKEVQALRGKVQKLTQELKCRKQNSAKLKPAMEHGERRTEALSKWYRQASEMLTSQQLSSRLPRLAEQAQQLLEVDLSAILIRETGRVRVWSGGLEVEGLKGSHPLESLGAVGRKTIEQGQVYRYQRTNRRADKFLEALGLSSALAIPMELEGRVLGCVLFGHAEARKFTSEEIDLARLTAYQSALFLENTLLMTGAEVERVVARAVLKSMADGVYTLDWEKRITSFNPAAELITGWRAEEAIGKTCSQVMKSRYLCASQEEPGGCEHNCPLLTLLADQKLMDSGVTVEGYTTHKSGEPRYMSSTYSVIADRGDLLGAVVLFRDITDKKRLEEMKSEYAAALSHDLKTPLTAMKGYAVTLLKHGDRLDDAARKEALEVINFEIDRVTRMFDNLLHQARLEAGVKNQHFTQINLSEAVNQVVKLYAFSGRSHALIADVEPDSICLTTDRDQLDQILNNLVSNALKYTPGGSKVVVRCRWGEEKQSVNFEVIDDGPGISEANLPFIFKRFHRLGGAASQRVRGTGLGLHITRMLVEDLGGEVGVTSELGVGSRFWFWLPLEPPEATDEKKKPPQ